MNRYETDRVVRDGKILQTNQTIAKIREGVSSGQIQTSSLVMNAGERLDTLAQKAYGDGRLWWIIAAVSNVGWWLQVPPGTELRLPIDLAEVEALI